MSTAPDPKPAKVDKRLGPKPRVTKICIDCGAEIPDAYHLTKRCVPCKTILNAKQSKERMRKHRGEVIDAKSLIATDLQGIIEVDCPECGTAFRKPAGSDVLHCRACYRNHRYDSEFQEQKRRLAEGVKVDLVRRELAMRELAARKLIAFVVRNQSDYLPGWVHKDIASRMERFLQEVIDKKSPRLMLQLPPRSGKSTLASYFFPAWALGKYPWLEFIACSYASSLAVDFSKRVRELMRSDEYAAVFPEAKLHPEEQNAEGWKTTAGGGYLPAGVGGPITGRGAHILVIDDPVKNSEEADSQTDREAKKAWYQSTAYTRLAPGGGLLILQTRWHSDDLSGWLESEMDAGVGDKFEIVRYPMVAIEDEPYRKQGEVLHAERYDLDYARRLERTVGPRVWSALFQQSPVSDSGQYFSKDMFRYYVPPHPPRMATYAAFDLAIGKNERNDYTVGVVVGVDAGDDIWVLDVVRGRWDAHAIVEQILYVQRTWTPELIGLEKGQIQLALGPYLEKRIQEERLYAINIQGLATGRRDKQARARAIQGRMKQGKVRFPETAPWLEALQLEMLAFPDGRHDDQCFVAGTLVRTTRGDVPIELVRVGEQVLTPDGPRPVTACAMTNRESVVYRTTLANGPELISTGNHPLMIPGWGCKNVGALSHGDKVLVCAETKQLGALRWWNTSFSRVLSTIGTQCPKEPHTGGITALEAGARPYIARCGNTIMGKYRRVCTSIIRAVISITTRSRTLSFSALPTICGTITLESTGRNPIWSTLPIFARLQRNGTQAKRVSHGTLKMGGKRGLVGRLLPANVPRAEKHLKPFSRHGLNTAPRLALSVSGLEGTQRSELSTNALTHLNQRFARCAGLLSNLRNLVRGRYARRSVETKTTTIVNVERLPGLYPTYNLAVAGTHIYVANGVWVHNCDALAHLGTVLEDMTANNSTPHQDQKTKPWKTRLGLFLQSPFRGRTPMSA